MKQPYFVPDRRTCIRLKELDFPQDSYFWMHLVEENDITENDTFINVTKDTYVLTSIGESIPKLKVVNDDNPVAAPTFQEIWDQLPYSIKDGKTHYLTLDKGEGTGYVSYLYEDEDSRLQFQREFQLNNLKTITQAVAELWIQLKEKGLI